MEVLILGMGIAREHEAGVKAKTAYPGTRYRNLNCIKIRQIYAEYHQTKSSHEAATGPICWSQARAATKHVTHVAADPIYSSLYVNAILLS